MPGWWVRRSTLATILAGGGTVSGGTILVDGKEVWLRNRRDAIAHGIVLVPPDRGEGIVPGFEVAENLTLGHVSQYAWKGLIINPRAERRATARYVDELNIRVPKGDAAARNLSGGNQQKVLIAARSTGHPGCWCSTSRRPASTSAPRSTSTASSARWPRTGWASSSSPPSWRTPLVADRTLVFSKGRVTHELPGSAGRSEIVHKLFEAARRRYRLSFRGRPPQRQRPFLGLLLMAQCWSCCLESLFLAPAAGIIRHPGQLPGDSQRGGRARVCGIGNHVPLSLVSSICPSAV